MLGNKSPINDSIGSLGYDGIGFIVVSEIIWGCLDEL